MAISSVLLVLCPLVSFVFFSFCARMRLVSITEVTGPNEEDAWYHVNLEKRTCG